MFFYLMFANLAIAVLVSLCVMSFFSKSINQIVARIISDPINTSWSRYTKFAGMVVGISSGIRVYEMERYITPLMPDKDNTNVILELTTERWFLEIYRTIIETLQGLAWMLLIFFVVSLIAYVLVKRSEKKLS